MNRKAIIFCITAFLLLGVTYAAIGANNKPTLKKSNRQDAANLNEVSQNDPLIPQIIAQQQDSRENLRRLAEGQIKDLKVDSPATGGNEEKRTHVSITYTDSELLGGEVITVPHDGKWVITKITRDTLIPAPKRVPTLTDEEKSLGQRILDNQLNENTQKFIADLNGGKISTIRLVNIEAPESDKETINAVVRLTDNTESNVKLKLEQVNGFWYLLGLE